jgi:hypothetical protein
MLSMPEVYLSINLVLVVVLLIAALWTRQTGPPVGEPRATALMTGRGVADAPAAARCNLDRNSLRSSAWQPQRDRRPFRDLEATLSASYTAKLEQAIRTIRVGRPPGRGQPINRPGERKAPAAGGLPLTRPGPPWEPRPG